MLNIKIRGQLPLVCIFSVFICICHSLTAQDSTRGIGSIKPTAATSEWGPTYAVVVGISKYKNITQLTYADDDAEAFRDFLLDTKIITDPNNIYYLIDSTATKTEIFRGLNTVLAKLKGDNNERVFIYFAGHGDTESETEEGYLLAYNCEKVAYDMTDAVFLPQFEAKVTAISKKAKVFLITDACRSGNLAGQSKGALRTMNTINNGFVNTIKILSCEPGQLSQEKSFPGGGHGVFTYFLLDALYGLGVNDDTKYIKVRDVESYLKQKVNENTNEQQSPIIVGTGSEIIAKVNPEMKQAIIAQKKNAGTGGLVAKRGDNDNRFKMTQDDSAYYKIFYEQLRAGRLNTPKGNNALEAYRIAKSKIKNEDLINAMKFDLAAKLEDAVQPLLNRFIRAEFQDYPDSLFNDADNKLKIVMDELMDTSDIRVNEIKAKRIFFIASVHKSPRSLELLRTADSFLPNSTFINFEIGRYYSEAAKPDSALIYLEKAIRLSPRWSYPKFMIGNIYFNAGDYEKARNFYSSAIELQPNFAYALYNQALTINELVRKNPAKYSYLKDSINFYANKAFTINKKIENIFAEKRNEGNGVQINGNTVFETKSLGDAKGAAHLHIMSLGESVRQTERTDENIFADLLPPATKKLTESISKEASDGYSYYSKAYYLNNDGKTDSANYWYTKAAEMFELAYKNGTMPLGYLYTWGYTQQSLNNFERAEEIYRLSLEKDTADFHFYYFGIAWIKDKEEQIDEAINWYRKAVAFKPDYYQAYNNIGWAYNRLQKKDSAIYYYKKSLTAKPGYLTSLYNLADLYYTASEDDSSIYYYKLITAIEKSPGADLFNRIGSSYEYSKNYDSAIAYYLKATQVNGNVSTYFKNLAEVYYKLGKYQDAITTYEKANTLITNGPKIYIDIALSHAFLNDYKTAETILKDGLKKDTTARLKYLYYYNLGWVMDNQKMLNDAIYWYSLSAKQKPEYADAFNNAGYAYDRLENSDSAIYWYNSALEANPTYTRAMYNIAAEYAQLKKYDSSIYYYKKIASVEKTPGADLYNSIAIWYDQLQNYDSAIAYLLKATQTDGTVSIYFKNLAEVYYTLGKYPEAITNFEKANTLITKGPKIYIDLALSHAYINDFKKAELVLKDGIKNDTTAWLKYLYYYNLGWVMDKQKMLNDAVQWYTKAAKQNPDYVAAYNNSGYTYERLGKSDSALYWYKAALNVDPKYTMSVNNLGYLYNELDKFDSSLHYYKLLFSLTPKEASASFEIAKLYYSKNIYDSSIIYFETALLYKQNSAEYYARAGDAYFDAAPDKKDWKAYYNRAIELYNEALKLDSTQFLAMNRLGVSYIYLEKFNEGINVFELALQKDAAYKNTYEYNLACIYSRKNEPSKALNYLERSFVSGYGDLAHMSEDTDLDNIRSLPAFRAIIEKHFKQTDIEKNPNLFKK